MLKILVFGSGAVGTLVGGLLAKSGHVVTFIGRETNVHAIRSTGIHISGLWGEHTIPPQPAFESVEEIPQNQRQFDWILITTKAFATEDAIQVCQPLVSEATFVISCQNGYGNCQLIAEQIGWHRTLGARVITGVELKQPGMINVIVHGDDMRLGHYHNELPMHVIESIALTMKEAGVPLQATDQVEQYIWAKILYNAALNPLGALLGVTYGELADEQHTRDCMNTIIEEAFQVTEAHGIKQFWDSADAYKDAFYHQMIPPTAAHFPSMLRDLERGKTTEVDAITGAVSFLGKQKNIPTPVNDTLTSLIHFRESRADHA